MTDDLGPVELAALRADQHWYDDGLPGLLRGLLLLVLAATLGGGPGHHSVFSSILILVAYGSSLYFLFVGNRWLLGPIKARLTYPRAGYTPPPPDPKPVDTGFFWPPIPSAREIEVVNRRETVAALAWVAYMLFNFAPALFGGNEWRWRVPMISLPLAAIVWFERPRPNASILAPLACILSGLTAWLANVPERQEVKIFSLLLGGFYFLQGLYQLVIFIRLHPRIRGENAPLS